MNYTKISKAFEWASKVSAVLTVPAIVLSTTPAVVLFHATIFFSLMVGNLRERFSFIVRNPMVLAFLLLFLLFLIGSTYSTAPMSEILIMLRKYSKYLLALAFFPVFVEEKWRDYAILAFMIGILVMLIASYLRTSGYLHWFAAGGVAEVFKISMVFNFLMAFAAYLCLLKITTTRCCRFIWLIFFGLIVYTVLFRSIGRSGYFVFIGLMLLFFIQKFRLRGLVIAVTGVVLLFSLAFILSPTFKGRMNAAYSDIKVYRQNSNTSVGLRMTFVKNSMKLVEAHPIFGTGTGSYLNEYNKIDPNNVFKNPHNEYVYFMVQFGALGLVILLLFFAIPLWYSQYLPEKEKYIARGIIIGVMVGSLANCWLFDATIRYCYAYFMVLAFAALPKDKGPQLINKS